MTINTSISSYFHRNNDIEKLFPIPRKHKGKIVYCKILYNFQKAFYYDGCKNLICKVKRLVK